MRLFLLITLFFSYIANSQVVADTILALKENGDTARIITYRNSATSTSVTPIRLKDSAQVLRNETNSGLSAKQNSLGFTPVPNTLTVNGKALNANISITQADVGLPNADNTSDANKPISNATQTALNNKSTYYVGLDAGANDSYVITASPIPASYTTGMIVLFRANTANTTGCTISVNGLGVKTINKRVSTATATGDILALMWCMLIYDGSSFIILNPIVN